MKALHFRSCLMLVCIGLLLSPSFAGDATMPATKPAAFTERDYAQATLDFNRRTLVDTYNVVGKHDARWDDPARKLLAGMAVYFTNGATTWRHRIANALSKQDLAVLGKQAVDAGCDDPQVLYCYGAILDDMQSPDAIPLLERAAAMFPNSHYPLFRAFSAAGRMMHHVQDNPEKMREYAKQQSDLGLTLVSLGDLKGIDRRIVCEIILDWLGSLPAAGQEQFYSELQKVDAEPWMADLIGGAVHIALAWDARGNGWAYTVTPQGWEGFARHLAEAQKCLVRAHESEPSYPEAAAKMIVVAMGRQSGAERYWFNRATAAQLDYLPAYWNLIEALDPRWCGSYGQMLALADECRAIGRYDTDVPYLAIQIVWRIAEERHGDLSIWKNDDVHRIVTEVLAGYQKQEQGDGRMTSYYRSLQVAMEWMREDWAAAKKVLDDLHGQLLSQPTEEFGTATWRIADEVQACAGKHGPAVLKARDLALTNVAAAHDAFLAIYKRMGVSDPGRRFVYDRARELGWQEKFEKGDWVSLPIGTSLGGWEPARGEWKGEKGGGVTSKSTDGPTLLLCMADFGNRFEFSADVELDRVERPAEANAGPIVGWLNDNSYSYMSLRRSSQQVFFDGVEHSTAWPAEIKDSNHFTVQVWDGITSAEVNDRQIFSNFPLKSADTASGQTRVGLGSDFFGVGGVATYRNVKIRKLTAKPPTVTTRPTTQPRFMIRMPATTTTAAGTETK